MARKTGKMEMNLPLFSTPSDWVPPKIGELPSWQACLRLGIDVETKDAGIGSGRGIGVRFQESFLAGVSISLNREKNFYMPLKHENDPDNMDWDQVIAYLKYEALHFKGELVGANIGYDLQYLAHEGIVFPNVKRFRDVQVNAPLIYELEFQYNLEIIAKRAGIQGKDETLLKETARNYGVDPKADLWRLPARNVGPYAEQDAELPLEILEYQEKEMERLGVLSIYDIESRLIPCIADMTMRGVAVDENRLAYVDDWATQQQKDCIAKIRTATGIELGIGDCTTPAMVHKILQKLKYDTGVTATHKPKTDKATLEALEDPIIDVLLRARRFDKISTMYVEPTIAHMVKGRIHPTFHQLKAEKNGDSKGTITGRLSCSNTNLQQQPSRDKEIAPMWRSIYVPDSDIWGCCDYSQQEPRIIVHYAELSGLKGAKEAGEKYRNDPNMDFHDMMEEITGLERKDAKEVFLGKCYGLGGPNLCRKLKLPVDTAMRKRLINGRWTKVMVEVAGKEGLDVMEKFDTNAPFVPLLSKYVQEICGQRGTLTTLLGRVRNFPVNKNGKGYDWLNKALNALIQGSAADQTKLAMAILYEEKYPLQLQVHDEVDLSLESIQQGREVKEIMEQCVKLTVPSKVDLEVGKNWGSVRLVKD